MSSTKNLRKRTSHVNYKEPEAAFRKKKKTEEGDSTKEEVASAKQPVVASNGKIFYPCQYCNKIFPQKTTRVAHMKKCRNLSVETKQVNENEPCVNNNDMNEDAKETNCLDSSGSSTENKSPQPKIRISQNITVKAAQQEKQAMNDTSVYDYNEQDEDNSNDKDSTENNEEDTANNRACKHCKTEFENPMDLLRHTRDCHNFPRTILPPDEIEKYFDSPNRNFCPICEKPIKTRNFRSVFIKHLLVHTSGLTHECGVCKKKFRRRDHMRAHEKRHIVSV